MTDSVNDIAIRLSMLKGLRDWLNAKDAEAKAELQQVFARGTAYATVDGVGEVGTVVVTATSTGTWEVQDEAAFTAWVKEHRPGAIVEAVRDSDRKVILAEIEKLGVLPDGVGIGASRAGYVTVKQSPVQREALQVAWEATDAFQALAALE